MNIHDIHRGIHKHKRGRRLGRGPGSGAGKTSSRGHKGQKSNPGYGFSAVWQGGAMPLVRRVPKRGFNNKFALDVAAVNICDLEKHFEPNQEVNPESLAATPLLNGRFDELKILGSGEIKKAFTVCAHRFSKSAKEKIEAAGGKAVVLPGKTKVADKKKAAAEKASPKSKNGKGKQE